MNFDTQIEYILENEIVRLRPLLKEDASELLYYSIHQPDIWKYSVLGADGEANLHTYIDTALQNRTQGHEYPFIVFDKKSGKSAGSTRFYDIQNSNDALQLGYTWYGEEFQHSAVNRNCKLLLLTFAFETLGAKRVEFRANLKNERSIEAMKKIGCVVEGVLRSNISETGKPRRDTIVLSILEGEWHGGVKERIVKMIESY